MRPDAFVTISARVLEVRATSARLDRSDLAAPVWIARAWVETADNIRLGQSEGQVIGFRMLGDRARDKGLI